MSLLLPSYLLITYVRASLVQGIVTGILYKLLYSVLVSGEIRYANLPVARGDFEFEVEDPAGI